MNCLEALTKSKDTKFKFKDQGKVLYNFARSLRELRKVVDPFVEARDVIARELIVKQREQKGQENAVDLIGPFATSFRDQIKPMGDKKETVDLRPVTLESLDLDKNFIDPALLSPMLGVMIIEPDEESEE